MPSAILLAEDNEDDVFFFKTAAKWLGWSHEIRVAGDGREAIEMLKSFMIGEGSASRLSLVLLDLKMPFVNGLEVLEWARGERALNFLPIAVLTSSEQENDIEAAYRLGAAAFLVKPSQPEKMRELLQSIESFWVRHNRLPAAAIDSAPRSFASQG